MIDSVNESMHQADEALAPSIDEMVHNAQQLARDLYTLRGNVVIRGIFERDQRLPGSGYQLNPFI